MSLTWLFFISGFAMNMEMWCVASLNFRIIISIDEQIINITLKAIGWKCCSFYLCLYFFTLSKSLMRRLFRDDCWAKLIPFLDVRLLIMALLPWSTPSFCFWIFPGLLARVDFFLDAHTNAPSLTAKFFPFLHCCPEMLGSNSEGEDSWVGSGKGGEIWAVTSRDDTNK